MKTPNSIKHRRDPSHDGGYKLLYSHSAMVRDLLCRFVPGAWVKGLDLSSLERCSGSYVTDDLRDRADDLIWRLRWGDDWLYVYLLLEFQSTIDRLDGGAHSDLSRAALPHRGVCHACRQCRNLD